MLPNRQHRALQTIALYEAAKGVLALLLVIGVFDLLHHDIRQLAHQIVGHYGWEVDGHYTSIFLHWVDVLSGINKVQFFSLACAYIALRFTEAYGLWHDRVWAEWLAAVSGGIYLPFEALHMWHAPSWSSILIFSFNVAMVAYLLLALRRTYQHGGPHNSSH